MTLQKKLETKLDSEKGGGLLSVKTVWSPILQCWRYYYYYWMCLSKGQVIGCCLLNQTRFSVETKVNRRISFNRYIMPNFIYTESHSYTLTQSLQPYITQSLQIITQSLQIITKIITDHDPVTLLHNAVITQHSPVTSQKNPVIADHNPVTAQHNPFTAQHISVTAHHNPYQKEIITQFILFNTVIFIQFPSSTLDGHIYLCTCWLLP